MQFEYSFAFFSYISVVLHMDIWICNIIMHIFNWPDTSIYIGYNKHIFFWSPEYACNRNAVYMLFFPQKINIVIRIQSIAGLMMSSWYPHSTRL